MYKYLRNGFAFFIFCLIASSFSVQQASAKSLADWNFFKDHPCTSAEANNYQNGLQMTCSGNFQDKPSIFVPLVMKNDQLPSVTMVYSMTGMTFSWAPLPCNYFQYGHLDRFNVSSTEYYADIVIHPFLYQIPQTSVPTSQYPSSVNIGNNITIQLGQQVDFHDIYGNTAPIGIAMGDSSNIDKYFGWSLPYQTKPSTGPSMQDIKIFIASTDPYYLLTNKSGAPANTNPYFDFDILHGAWFFSTISSVYGSINWNGEQAFPINIDYMVEMRAFAEPRQHFKWETRMVAPEERGWVCHSTGLPFPLPSGCITSDGKNGYWSWEVVKDATYKTGWWAYPINPSKDWGGVLSGPNNLPESTLDSASYCNFCRQRIMQWMAPDLSGVLPYFPLVVYESHPLLSPPW